MFLSCVGKIQALLVFCLGFAFRQKPNVLECALALLACCLTVGGMKRSGVRDCEPIPLYRLCQQELSLQIALKPLCFMTACWAYVLYLFFSYFSIESITKSIGIFVISDICSNDNPSFLSLKDKCSKVSPTSIMFLSRS